MTLWTALRRVVISCVKVSAFETLIIPAWTLFKACVYENCKEKQNDIRMHELHRGTKVRTGNQTLVSGVCVYPFLG